MPIDGSSAASNSGSPKISKKACDKRVHRISGDMMLRSELVAKLSAANPALTREEADRIVSTVFDTIAAHLSVGGRVELRGFGVFTVKKRNARTGRNPRDGASVQVQAKKIPAFRIGKELHRRLNPE
jgi:integration host factor subunit beta